MITEISRVLSYMIPPTKQDAKKVGILENICETSLTSKRASILERLCGIFWGLQYLYIYIYMYVCIYIYNIMYIYIIFRLYRMMPLSDVNVGL